MALNRLGSFGSAWAGVAVMACAGSGASAGCAPAPQAAPALTFEQALLADSSNYEPPTAFRAVAEDDWAQAAMTGSVAGTVVEGSKWKLGDSCEVHFTRESEVLAASESAPLPDAQARRGRLSRAHRLLADVSGSRVLLDAARRQLERRVLRRLRRRLHDAAAALPAAAQLARAPGALIAMPQSWRGRRGSWRSARWRRRPTT